MVTIEEPSRIDVTLGRGARHWFLDVVSSGTTQSLLAESIGPADLDERTAVTLAASRLRRVCLADDLAPWIPTPDESVRERRVLRTYAVRPA